MKPEDLEEAARLLREGKATPEDVARTLMSRSKEAFEKTRAADGPVAGEPVPGAAQPKSFGKYEILGEIARGGMGVVYRAREAKLNRVVALKVLLAGEGASEEQIVRFTGEARAAAALQHPGIVQIFDVGEERGVHYFAMEYVEGIALDRLIKRDGPLPPMQALRVVREVARALQFAHEKGIIHRDVKPGNILMAGLTVTSSGLERSADASAPLERVKLSDFGLAKDLSVESSLTVSGNLLGTPGYMSPEQAAGKTSEIDARSDVFSLGAVAYHALTGDMPFGGATIADVLTNIRTTDARPMRTLRAGLHRDVEIIVGKALAREKERRYQTARELADDIDRYLRGEAIRAAPPSYVYRATRFAQRHRAGVLAACVCLLAVGAAGGGSIWRSMDARRDRLGKARGHAAEALRLSKEGRFDESYVALGLSEALEASLPEASAARAEIRFSHATAQVDALAAQDNWEGAKAVLSAFSDVRANPGFGPLARRVAGTAILSVVSTDSGVDVDMGPCVPGVVWDEEVFISRD
ncbi:MAG: serine/threonine protein [Planctomycetota bacterium]|nr:MAG: serine/threonine protein [Planctomycetota bacterium]